METVRFDGAAYTIGRPGARYEVRGPTAEELARLDAIVAADPRMRVARVGPCEYVLIQGRLGELRGTR